MPPNRDLDDRYDLDDDGAPVGICDDCGQACRGKLVDNGIGRYEYWGATGTHHDWGWESPCCGADIVEGGATELPATIHTARKYYAPDIRPGDRYRRTVTRHWRKGGPTWYTVTRRRVYALAS